MSLKGIFDAGSNILGDIYSIYNNERSYNYNKNLNNKIFEREDNALQRRTADALRAGLSPVFFGANTGAGSGGSVSPQGFNDLQVGKSRIFTELANLRSQTDLNNVSAEVTRKTQEQNESLIDSQVSNLEAQTKINEEIFNINAEYARTHKLPYGVMLQTHPVYNTAKEVVTRLINTYFTDKDDDSQEIKNAKKFFRNLFNEYSSYHDYSDKK